MATLTDATKKSLRREMEGIVGADAVLSDPDELLVYESDGLTLFRALADFVVFPTTAEHVSALVKLANREGMPFVARGATACDRCRLTSPGSTTAIWLS